MKIEIVLKEEPFSKNAKGLGIGMPESIVYLQKHFGAKRAPRYTQEADKLTLEVDNEDIEMVLIDGKPYVEKQNSE